MTITYDGANPRFPDVNHYVSVSDRAAFAAAKPVVLGAKATEGAYTDPTFGTHEAIAIALDIPLIAYDFVHTGNASHFLSEVRPKTKGVIPCGDFEAADLTMPEAEAWVKQVSTAWGHLPWIYGHSLLNSWNPSPTSVLRQCPAWQPTYAMSLAPTPWVKKVVAWQYSNGSTKWASPGPRSFPGVGPCDMNTSYLSVADLRVAAGLAVPPPKPPPGGPVLTDADAKQLGFATVADWRIQQDRSKAISDALLGLPKRTGQSAAYDAAYDTAAPKFP